MCHYQVHCPDLINKRTTFLDKLSDIDVDLLNLKYTPIAGVLYVAIGKGFLTPLFFERPHYFLFSSFLNFFQLHPLPRVQPSLSHCSSCFFDWMGDCATFDWMGNCATFDVLFYLMILCIYACRALLP